MDKKTHKNNGYMSRALISPNSFNKEKKSFDVVFASENPCFRRGWEEDYNEILGCTSSECRMERANRGLPVFDNHPWDKKASEQLGRCVDIKFENNQLVGTIVLGARADEALISDIESGIVKDISVGYNVYRFVREPTGEGKVPNYRAVDWEPFEVSFAPVQADVKSEIRSNNEEVITEIEYSQKNINMTEEEKEAARKAEELKIENARKAEEQRKADEEAKKRASEEVELARKQAIESQNKLRGEITVAVRAAKLPDSKIIEYLDSGKSIDEVRALVIEEFVKQDPKTNNINMGKEASEKKRAAVEGAIISRVAPKLLKEGDEKGGEYRGMSLIELGCSLLEENGISTRGMTKDEKTRLLLKRDLSTSDFPLLLENVANKMLRGEYKQTPEFWSMIAKRDTVSDFKEKSLYQIDSVNGMKEIKEGGEIVDTTLIEAKQKISVKTFGEGIRLTRQDIINDDLSAFTVIPNKFVRDWDTLRGDTVWGLITDNTVMGDGKAMFHNDHSNIVTPAGALSEATLEAAILKLTTQKGLDGKTTIRVTPKYIIVAPTQKVVAMKLLTTITPNQVSNVNIFSSMGLEIIVEPRLTGNAWYLAADPNEIDGLVYAYLDGQEGLRAEREEDFKTDSINFRVRGDFGATIIDYRGWQKNAGA